MLSFRLMFQHYIPRAYLAGFVSSGIKPGHEPWLWVTDKVNGTQKKRAPKKIAGGKNYYEQVGTTNGPGRGLEARLAQVEARVRRVVLQLERDGPYSGSLGFEFCWFLATLCVRTPWAKSAVEMHRQAHRPSGVLASLDPMEQWAASVEYYASWVHEYFRRMDWILCGPRDLDSFFLTSDRPVVLSGDNMNGSILDVLRLTEKSSYVTVPVSSRLALIGTYRGKSVFRSGVSTFEVNNRTFDSATRYVYSANKLSFG